MVPSFDSGSESWSWCWWFYCPKSTKYRAQYPNAIWQMSPLRQLHLRPLPYLSLSFSLLHFLTLHLSTYATCTLPTYPPNRPQCLVAVVYVILLFHIVPFKKQSQGRSSQGSKHWPGFWDFSSNGSLKMRDMVPACLSTSSGSFTVGRTSFTRLVCPFFGV